MHLKIGEQHGEVHLPGGPRGLDFSNDGTLLACATARHHSADLGLNGPVVSILRTDGGSVLNRFYNSTSYAGKDVVFINDGRALVYLWTSKSGGFYLQQAAVDSRDSDQLRGYGPAERHHGIVRDQAGRHFAVLGNQVEIWDAGAGKVLHTLPGADPYKGVQAAFSGDGSRIYVYGSLEKMVVCYDVATLDEVARWEAPQPDGSQVLITPDERILLIVGSSHTGVFIYDLAENVRLPSDADGFNAFEENSRSSHWAVAYDSSALFTLMGRMVTFRPPELKNVTVRKKIVEPYIDTWVSAWAWEAPIIAFGTFQDDKVRWFRLKPADE